LYDFLKKHPAVEEIAEGIQVVCTAISIADGIATLGDAVASISLSIKMEESEAAVEEIEAALPLDTRAEQLGRQFGTAFNKNPAAARDQAFSVGEPKGGGGLRIVNVLSGEAYEAVASGKIPLLPDEVLGRPRIGNLHVEEMTALDGTALGAEGGKVGTWPRACDDCGGKFYFGRFPGWTHVNPNPNNDYAKTPREWYVDK
jgi:hypothetical protein